MVESVVVSYLVLFLSNHTTIQLEYKTQLRLGIIIIRLEASVVVAHQYQFLPS